MKTTRFISLALLLFISFKMYSTVHIIKQSGTSFSPTDLTVNVGDIVRWEWSAGTHTTTSKIIPDGAAAWNNPLTSSSTSFEYAVTVAGKYDYVCTPHESMGMKGSFTAQVVSDVNEKSYGESISLYPNPATSFLNISTSLFGQVTLSNILGETIQDFSLNEFQQSTNSYQIDLSDLNNGIYFITIIPSETKKRISAKFIKR